MKLISFRELHENTRARVRKLARVGPLVITNREKSVAKFEAAIADPQINPFLARKLRPGYAQLRGKLGGGSESTRIVSDDRDRR